MLLFTQATILWLILMNGNRVFIKTLPTYCPELNSIEILWHFIKYLWLPFSAFISYNALVKEVENILAQIGNEYTIDFAY